MTIGPCVITSRTPDAGLEGDVYAVTYGDALTAITFASFTYEPACSYTYVYTAVLYSKDGVVQAGGTAIPTFLSLGTNAFSWVTAEFNSDDEGTYVIDLIGTVGGVSVSSRFTVEITGCLANVVTANAV